MSCLPTKVLFQNVRRLLHGVFDLESGSINKRNGIVLCPTFLIFLSYNFGIVEVINFKNLLAQFHKQISFRPKG